MDCEPEAISGWVAEVRAIPADEMASMLNPPGVVPGLDERALLLRAAYFAHFATSYPPRSPRRRVPESYTLFLSADLLREQFGCGGGSGR